MRTPLYALQAWVCCAASAAIATPDTRRARRRCASPARALLIAAPLAVVLFLFFPRLPGAFWAIPRGGAALTGLSDAMTPGQHRAAGRRLPTAFRVRFAGPRPAGAALYWRGPVLHDFDGRTWRRPAEVFRTRQPAGVPGRRRCATASRSSPRRQRFWFALDMPARSPAARVFLTYDYQLLARRPGHRAGQLRGGLLPAHARARAARAPAAGARTPPCRPVPIRARASWRRRCTQRAGSDAAYVQRGARVPAQRRLRVLARATAARGATRSTICCSARARASAVTMPRPSSR